MKKLIYCIFIFCFIGTSSVFSEDVLTETAQYVYENTPSPSYGSVGGEWAVLGLSRGDFAIPESYFSQYTENIYAAIQEKNGVLHARKNTEYARVALALTALKKNPSDAAGYNLLCVFSNFDKTVQQGINGAVWALIALDAGAYEIPKSETEPCATREQYVSYILSRQLPDGGWGLGDSSDPDVTAMALTALSSYREAPNVDRAIEKALLCLSSMQDETGGFSGGCESVAQVIVALTTLDISLHDARFVKNGSTVYDHLMLYAVPGGGFVHTLSETTVNPMATEQALYALVAIQRKATEKTALFDMTDMKPPYFSDTKHPAVLALAQRKMILGKSEHIFAPHDYMTRAEFSAVVVRALALSPKNTAVFSDVHSDAWFFSYVGTAYAHGIVLGTSSDTFSPYDTITGQEAAVMLYRVAPLCGINITLSDTDRAKALSLYPYAKEAADWSIPALAFCCSINALPDVHPTAYATREEIAVMLHALLSYAHLL